MPIYGEKANEVRLIVAGTRNFTNYPLVKRELDNQVRKIQTEYPGVRIVIISGGARGADLLGERFAKEHGFAVVRFPAKWDLYGKQAGPVRNRKMLEYAREGIPMLMAFWDGLSKGTRNMIDISKAAGIQVSIKNILGEQL